MKNISRGEPQRSVSGCAGQWGLDFTLLLQTDEGVLMKRRFSGEDSKPQRVPQTPGQRSFWRGAEGRGVALRIATLGPGPRAAATPLRPLRATPLDRTLPAARRPRPCPRPRPRRAHSPAGARTRHTGAARARALRPRPPPASETESCTPDRRLG